MKTEIRFYYNKMMRSEFDVSAYDNLKEGKKWLAKMLEYKDGGMISLFDNKGERERYIYNNIERKFEKEYSRT